MFNGVNFFLFWWRFDPFYEFQIFLCFNSIDESNLPLIVNVFPHFKFLSFSSWRFPVGEFPLSSVGIHSEFQRSLQNNSHCFGWFHFGGYLRGSVLVSIFVFNFLCFIFERSVSRLFGITLTTPQKHSYEKLLVFVSIYNKNYLKLFTEISMNRDQFKKQW